MSRFDQCVAELPVPCLPSNVPETLPGWWNSSWEGRVQLGRGSSPLLECLPSPCSGDSLPLLLLLARMASGDELP